MTDVVRSVDVHVTGLGMRMPLVEPLNHLVVRIDEDGVNASREPLGPGGLRAA